VMFLEECRMAKRTGCYSTTSKLITHVGSTKTVSAFSQFPYHVFNVGDAKLTQHKRTWFLADRTVSSPL
jgi:hypothetical protein